VTPQVRQIVEEFQRGLEEIYGDRLVRLVLFGSQARGDARPYSDIDIMVVLHGDVEPLTEASRTGKFTSDLCLQHNVVISCVYFSAGEAVTSQRPLLQNIRSEGIAV